MENGGRDKIECDASEPQVYTGLPETATLLLIMMFFVLMGFYSYICTFSYSDLNHMRVAAFQQIHEYHYVLGYKLIGIVKKKKNHMSTFLDSFSIVCM